METILLLCPHNAAKSIMAEAYYNHRVQQEGLPFLADSAGTEPSEQIWLTVIELLQREGIPLTSQIPRQVTRDDLLDAFQVISMGGVRSRRLKDFRGSSSLGRMFLWRVQIYSRAGWPFVSMSTSSFLSWHMQRSRRIERRLIPFSTGK
jgi:protein-tyrosine-phosphatase